MSGVMRQGMVKAVYVREYEGEAKFLKVTIKSPTDLPIASWMSDKAARHIDEFDIALPLDAIVRPGDMVVVNIEIAAPMEVNRFRPALEVGDDPFEVMVEDSLIVEAKEAE